MGPHFVCLRMAGSPFSDHRPIVSARRVPRHLPSPQQHLRPEVAAALSFRYRAQLCYAQLLAQHEEQAREARFKEFLLEQRVPRSEAEIDFDLYRVSPLDQPKAVAQRDADEAFVAQSELLHGASIAEAKLKEAFQGDGGGGEAAGPAKPPREAASEASLPREVSHASKERHSRCSGEASSPCAAAVCAAAGLAPKPRAAGALPEDAFFPPAALRPFLAAAAQTGGGARRRSPGSACGAARSEIDSVPAFDGIVDHTQENAVVALFLFNRCIRI